MNLFKRDKHKEDVQSILNKGIDFDIGGEHDGALSCYDRALKIDPDSIYVLINKGTALDNLGRRAEALRCYDRALELAPGNVDALVNKAVTLYNCQRNNEVLLICDQILQIQPYNARILYIKGIVLESVGNVSEAKAYLDKATELDPKLDNSLNTQVALSRTVFEKPISYYDKALELDPNNEDALANKSLTIANMDKYKEAILIEQYFLEEELRDNWRIISTNQQSITNQPRSRDWQVSNAADNTGCEIHLVTHDELRLTLKFKNDANVLVTSTRIRYNFEDQMQESQQPL